MFKKELDILLKNIYISKSISKLDGKAKEYLDFLEIFSNKYSPETVKAAIRELYNFNKEIEDIKRLTAAIIMKNYSI